MQLLRGDGRPLRIGHRGAALLAPENSLQAIEAAAAHGADAVELDVVPRADGSLVVAHGPQIPPDAPPLDEALARAASLELAVQMDVKVAGVAGGVVAALRRHDLVGRAFVSSWSVPILLAFRAAEPALPRSLTYPEDRHGLTGRRGLAPGVRAALVLLRAAAPARLPALLRASQAAAATLNAAVVSRRVVAACHGRGAAVLVWTVNDPALAATLVENGVDGIITDDPRILPRATPAR